jgi:hypothetical protein
MISVRWCLYVFEYCSLLCKVALSAGVTLNFYEFEDIMYYIEQWKLKNYYVCAHPFVKTLFLSERIT